MKQAGIPWSQAVLTFVGVKCLLSVTLSALLAIAPTHPSGRTRPSAQRTLGVLVGMIWPEAWLSTVVKRRQRHVAARPARRSRHVGAVPGKAGSAWPRPLQRVSSEMRRAHPLLADGCHDGDETQLGMSVARRQVVREPPRPQGAQELASVLLQSERYGSSLVMRCASIRHARQERYWARAEETAQKAAVKILFRTMLFILPGIFIVILGPAAYQSQNSSRIAEETDDGATSIG